MLNWRENDYLTLQVPPSLVMNNPYIKVKSLLMLSLSLTLDFPSALFQEGRNIYIGYEMVKDVFCYFIAILLMLTSLGYCRNKCYKLTEFLTF